MAGPKDVLVVTTSTVDGLKIKRYLKPVSAHVVAGTNVFSDIFASFSDVFGGRSQTYQKQLTSLYNEAIEKVKIAAYEIGANGILGLSIDLDEISGKGKSMFMLTAVGTAVLLEKEVIQKAASPVFEEKLEHVGVDRINNLRSKRIVIGRANSGNLKLDESVWKFITANQIDEIFPFVVHQLSELILNEHFSKEEIDKFYPWFVAYIDGLPEQKKLSLLYNGIREQDESTAVKLSGVVKELQLFDFKSILDILKNEDFHIRKRGVRLSTYDKPFYNKQDVEDLQTIRNYIQRTFIERGSRSTKKQVLAKEREVWTCECGKSNEMGSYCYGCGQDIYGFKEKEMKPAAADKYIGEKIELINESI